MSVVFGLSRAVASYYHVLRGIDLGADASSLFDGVERPWSAELSRLYPRGTNLATRLQVLPLVAPDLETVTRRLRAMEDAFCLALADVLDREAPALRDDWNRQLPDLQTRTDAVAETMTEELEVARTVLWSYANRTPAKALILHASIDGHGRAATTTGHQVIAVSFADPDAQLFCQILHEDTHAISDPMVMATWNGGPRSTKRGAPGFTLHEVLEARALALTHDVLARTVPQRLADYERWVQPRSSRMGSR